ncbi:MAG: Rnase Y domain-containing protein, partial [Anaerobacillus sp.]
MDIVIIISTMLVSAVVGAVVGFLVRKTIAEAKISSAEMEAQRIIKEGKNDAEALKKEAMLEAKDENHNLRVEAEREIRERRNELQKQENRLVQKEEVLDRKSETLDKKEDSLERREDSLTKKQRQIEEMESKVEELLQEQQNELQRISGLTREEAKQIIFRESEQELEHELAQMVKERENYAKEEADKKAREVLSLAIQR